MSRPLRALVVALIVLAASPVTAPFSTCDLLDLFGYDLPISPTAIQSPQIKDSAPVPVLRPNLLPLPDSTIRGIAPGAALVLEARHLSSPLRL